MSKEKAATTCAVTASSETDSGILLMRAASGSSLPSNLHRSRTQPLELLGKQLPDRFCYRLRSIAITAVACLQTPALYLELPAVECSHFLQRDRLGIPSGFSRQQLYNLNYSFFYFFRFNISHLSFYHSKVVGHT